MGAHVYSPQGIHPSGGLPQYPAVVQVDGDYAAGCIRLAFVCHKRLLGIRGHDHSMWISDREGEPRSLAQDGDFDDGS